MKTRFTGYDFHSSMRPPNTKFTRFSLNLLVLDERTTVIFEHCVKQCIPSDNMLHTVPAGCSPTVNDNIQNMARNNLRFVYVEQIKLSKMLIMLANKRELSPKQRDNNSQ